MRRRAFLKAAGTTGLAAVLARPLWALPRDSRYRKTIGLQLYTVRNQLEKDMQGTIQAVAQAGYRQVELMRVVGAEPVLAAARDAGLDVTSAFIDWRTIVSPEAEGVPSLDATLEAAAKHNFGYLVFGYIGKGHRESADQLKVLAERANRAGEKCRGAGIQFCYHHHSFEFDKLPGGKTGWQIFLDEFDPKLVSLELDVFWAAIGGKDPVATIHSLRGRITQLHLKDLKAGMGVIFDEAKVPHEAFQEVGNGLIDWAAVLEAAEATGVAQCHVEQDQSPDPMESIGQSLAYLRRL